LKKLNLQIRKGDFVCIIGDVASGKSSLLSALIGDLLVLSSQHFQELGDACINDEHTNKIVLEDSRKPISEAPITITQDVSYVQ
jgi:ABC-type uncharacterized transport system ATPase component